MDLDELKYPIGKFDIPEEIDEATIESWIGQLEVFPENLRKLVENLSYDSLEWVYRPKGWSVKQVVHHLADMHMNSFLRFKRTLTEDLPEIETPDIEEWAKTADGSNEEVASSLDLLEGLHKKWVVLLRSLESRDFKKKFLHKRSGRERSLGWLLGLYAWHGDHHIAHIKQAVEKEGDFVWED